MKTFQFMFLSFGKPMRAAVDARNLTDALKELRASFGNSIVIKSVNPVTHM